VNPQGAPAKVDARDYADLRTLNGAAYGLADEDRLVLEYIWQDSYFPWQGRRTWVRLRCSDPDAPDESLLPGMSASAFGSRVTKLAELGFFEKMDPKDDANHTKCDHEHGQYWCRVHIRGMCLPVLPLPERPVKPEPEEKGPHAPPVEPGVSCPKCGGPCRASAYKCTRFGCGHEFTAQERASAERKAARHLQVVPSPEPAAPENVEPIIHAPAPPAAAPLALGPVPPKRNVTHPEPEPAPSKTPHVPTPHADGTPYPPFVWAPHPTVRGVLRGGQGAMGSESLARTLPAPVRDAEGAATTERGAKRILDGDGKLAGDSDLAPLAEALTRPAPGSNNAEGP